MEPLCLSPEPFLRQKAPGLLGFSGDSVVQNPPANAGDTGDAGSIPGPGRSPGEGNGPSIPAWETPWTEEPGGLQSVGSHSQDMTKWRACTHIWPLIHLEQCSSRLQRILCFIMCLELWGAPDKKGTKTWPCPEGTPNPAHWSPCSQTSCLS